LGPTITTFDVLEIPVPPSVVVKALGRAILLDPEIKSIVLVHSPLHRDKGGRPNRAGGKNRVFHSLYTFEHLFRTFEYTLGGP
jgi:hypothetical protein